MKITLFLLSLLALSSNAFALDFQYNKNHCAAREYQPKNPKSGGTSGLLDSTAWAETGLCLKTPIEDLVTAAKNTGVMTWEGITKIVKVEKLGKRKPNDLFRVKISYDARHKHLWCQSAEWPIEWRMRLDDGTETAPTKVTIEADRVEGGDSNGGYIRQMSARIELVKDSDRETSLHMRYEVRAPSQAPSWAVGAITGYAGRLDKVANGGHAPGAVIDPACPY